MRRATARGVLVLALIATGLVASVASTPAAQADPAATITLTADPHPMPGPGQSVTLRAESSYDTTTDVYSIAIWDVDARTVLKYCDGWTCAVPVSKTAGIGNYQAVIGWNWCCYPAQQVKAVSNVVTVTWGVGSTTPLQSSWPSSKCDSGQIVTNNESQGTRVKVYTLSTSTSTALCYRIDIAGEGYGGKLTLNYGVPSVDVDTIGVPERDSATEACATTNPPNAVPGTHPIIKNDNIAGSFFVDAYVNTTVGAWLCISTGESDAENFRYIIPMEIPGVDVQHNLVPTLEQDPAT